ncbi:MAG: hypothetical protein J6Y02_24155 [Pseudobutyrivibrio sp.]|nr:hypothetical protein [Pseudobutyrivibrio sp.]
MAIQVNENGTLKTTGGSGNISIRGFMQDPTKAGTQYCHYGTWEEMSTPAKGTSMIEYDFVPNRVLIIPNMQQGNSSGSYFYFQWLLLEQGSSSKAPYYGKNPNNAECTILLSGNALSFTNASTSSVVKWNMIVIAVG